MASFFVEDQPEVPAAKVKACCEFNALKQMNTIAKITLNHRGPNPIDATPRRDDDLEREWTSVGRKCFSSVNLVSAAASAPSN